MKAIITVLVIVFCCPFLSYAQSVDLEQAEQDVKSVLDQYVASVELEDMEKYASIVCQDAEMVNFGAFGTPIVGWEGLHVVMEGQNAGLDAIKVDQSEVQIHIFPSGTHAWATSQWRFQAKAGEDTLDLPVRCTWVLEKRGKDWKIIHFHKSISAG